MIAIDYDLQASALSGALRRFWELSAVKLRSLEQSYIPENGTPVFTVNGRYTSRGWTEWTQGFQFGSALLQFDATGEEEFLQIGRSRTLNYMAPHLSHIGVHDHGFNNVSTYGNLLRLMGERRIADNPWERHFYELALKVSGAVQASRWTSLPAGGGYMYSFNGPHSLFVDTIRSCRSLMLAHRLGHVLQVENDLRVSLLERALAHMKSTALYSVYYGEGRDRWDVWGRTVHESIFNTVDGQYRCPGSQQGYSGRSTWTRGLAWALCGFAEELELLETLGDEELEATGGRSALESLLLRAARATGDHYIELAAADGIPYWDSGAPNLHRLGDYGRRPAEPFNDWEPVDSSAACIAAQGLLRLGHYLAGCGFEEEGRTYFQAGLSTARSLCMNPTSARMRDIRD
jgi:unsaturated chondroitin disaccharide hydrolase